MSAALYNYFIYPVVVVIHATTLVRIVDAAIAAAESQSTYMWESSPTFAVLCRSERRLKALLERNPAGLAVLRFFSLLHFCSRQLFMGNVFAMFSQVVKKRYALVVEVEVDDAQEPALRRWVEYPLRGWLPGFPQTQPVLPNFCASSHTLF